MAIEWVNWVGPPRQADKDDPYHPTILGGSWSAVAKLYRAAIKICALQVELWAIDDLIRIT